MEKTAMEIIVKLYSTKSVLGATTKKLNAVWVQKKKEYGRRGGTRTEEQVWQDSPKWTKTKLI
jgi:hypothetical protein